MLKKILLGILIVVLILIIGGAVYYRLALYQPPLISVKDRARVNLMPLPAKLDLRKGYLDLSDGMVIRYAGHQTALTEKSLDRLLRVLAEKSTTDLIYPGGVKFTINCLTDSARNVPQLNDDESYRLKIGKEINLTAQTHFGIIRGMETLAQLAVFENGRLMLPKVKIEDHPRFAWRGLMLDVCRHWIPKDVVLRTLDAMAAVKMNVFHWHLTEDQGFRVESKVFPKLHEVGSNGKYYTQAEIREVIAYAAERGIRVIPEFDLPGHSKSWQIAYPELSTVPGPLEFGRQNGELFAPPLDPTKESVYEFLDAFIGEMAALFPDRYMHIGGDEVEPRYWNQSETVQRFMKENGMKDSHDLQAWFNFRMQKILARHGKTMVGWEEILHPDLGREIVIQSWKSQKTLFEGVQRGGNAILSAGLYLDHKLHAGEHYLVDPLVMRGAVDITPDTAHWKMYDIVMEIPSGEMDGKIVLFDRDPGNVFGFFEFLGNRTAFKNGTVTGNEISFKIKTPMGELDYSGTLFPDSISGKLALAMLKFSSSGKLSGSSEMAGTQLPKIEVIKPLTEEEKSRILGGEAALWSEVVGENNAESRIWPRTAAIAEKLWSPAELTNDVDDMYRRLESVSVYLAERGSEHHAQMGKILEPMIAPEGLPYLVNLVEILEEVKYYARLSPIMSLDSVYLPDLPLNRVVDAARPESIEARRFNLLADEFLADTNLQEPKQKILQYLETWAENHKNLEPWFERSEKLGEVKALSEALAEVSVTMHAALNQNGKPFTEEERQNLLDKITLLETGENDVLVAVAPGLRRLASEI